MVPYYYHVYDGDLANTSQDPIINSPSTRREFSQLNTNARPRESNHRPGRSKKRHRSSSDSSILPERLEPAGTIQPSKGDERLEENEPGVKHRASKRHRSKSSAASRASLNVRPREKETFEKRARHKTREDRYEPKVKSSKVEKDDKERETRRSTSKRLKKNDRNKPKKDGGELMRNFSSKSIGQERLTVGIFIEHHLHVLTIGRSVHPSD